MKITIRFIPGLLVVLMLCGGCSDSQRAEANKDVEALEDAGDPEDSGAHEDARDTGNATVEDAHAADARDSGADTAAPADARAEDAQPNADTSDTNPSTGADADTTEEPGPPAKIWSHFNWPPDHGGSDPTITRELIRMIDATPDDGRIRGNFFILDLANVAAAINRAYDRGVRVRITLDGGPSNRAFAAARSVDTHTGISAGYCGGRDKATESVGCITDRPGGIAHSKFMTFSETVAPDGVLYPNVTWIASYNANLSSGDNDSNNTLSIYDAPVTYEAFRVHQVRMQAQRHYPENDYYDRASGRGYVNDPAAHLEAHISPEKQTNLVMAQLERITPDAQCIIRVFQAAIGSSFTGVMRKLVELQDVRDGVRHGCRVFVVTDGFAEQSVSILQAAGIEVRKIHNVHDKIFLIDAKFDGSAEHRKIVFTGSHNWAAKSSYGNDEILVSVETEEQYAAFYAHFLKAWRAAQAW